jgi:hypothetical protein
MLVLLEARFRKMLDEQTEVYDETKHLDASKAEAHEIEISAGRLSRRETLIVREADRALVLLREDGTSVAFPGRSSRRDDMQQIMSGNRVKTDLLTQEWKTSSRRENCWPQCGSSSTSSATKSPAATGGGPRRTAVGGYWPSCV